MYFPATGNDTCFASDLKLLEINGTILPIASGKILQEAVSYIAYCPASCAIMTIIGYVPITLTISESSILLACIALVDYLKHTNDHNL